jgi:hypothetical protein
VVGQVVVVFDRGEGCGFAKEAEMVDWDGLREDDLEGLGRLAEWLGNWKLGVGIPSSMPKPDRNMGMREMLVGAMVVVV